MKFLAVLNISYPKQGQRVTGTLNVDITSPGSRRPTLAEVREVEDKIAATCGHPREAVVLANLIELGDD